MFGTPAPKRLSMVSRLRPPNPRVQRTRSSASPPHSPLTRHPLGGRITLVAVLAVSLGLASERPALVTCAGESPHRNLLVLYYDSEYLFAGQGYGDSRDFGGNTKPALFVHSKATGTWIRIVAISTQS